MSPLDLVRRRPSARATVDPAPPGAPRTSVAERVVARTAGVLSSHHSRRRFLARTAVVGSALAVDPTSFIFKPGTAYGAVCGTCGDGWTAFCCTINRGKNSCPPNTFVAGWWKADNAAYCCGGPRYIIDCNATCPTRCSCRCSGASCDGRRTCCNQFRYGQCNQQISCYGPVACRVAICITPWAYDAACSTLSLTDNRTVEHGGACISAECDSAITRRYYALGGPEGLLGIRTQSERTSTAGRGRYATYQGGRLYWTSATGAHEIHGSIFDVWAAARGPGGVYGFPTTDVVGDARVRYSRFENGGIYRWAEGTYGVPDPYHEVFLRYGGPNAGSALGLPSSPIRRSGDRRALYQNYQRGRIYRRGPLTVEIHGAIYFKHEALGGIYSPLGHVATDVGTLPDGRGRASIFENGGVIYYTSSTGAHGVWGGLLDAYIDYGGWASDAGYPTSDRTDVGDGRGVTFTTERAQVWGTSTTGSWVVPGPVLGPYRARGGPQGSLGYPVGAAQRLADGTYRQDFENGSIGQDPSDNRPFVRAAYADFLDRAPTADELTVTNSALGSGAASRAGVVRDLARTPEYVSTLVDRLYVDTLGRPGDAGGTSFWTEEIRSGRRRVAEVAARFYASPEYYDGSGGGTDRSWIADLYQKLLGRAASEDDLDFWAAQTASRGRSSVAFRLYQSKESRRTRVNRVYQALLGRDADPAGSDYWSERIAGEGDLALAISLASLSEYADKAETRFPS